jgi:hypothetical protein
VGQWVDDVLVVAAVVVEDKVDDEADEAVVRAAVDDTAFHCPWLDKVVFAGT